MRTLSREFVTSGFMKVGTSHILNTRTLILQPSLPATISETEWKTLSIINQYQVFKWTERCECEGESDFDQEFIAKGGKGAETNVSVKLKVILINIK